MKRDILRVLVLAALVTGPCASGVTKAHAGANVTHKIAVHVVAQGLSCKSLPAFTECSQISTTYSGTGDISVVPVFFDLSEYTVVEFAITWPAEWGSCEYVTCVPTLDIGGIVNPGDGIASAWTSCQTSWAVCHGYGRLSATGDGYISVAPNPTTGDYGVVDCSPEPGPFYDPPGATFSSGIGGADGDDPCEEQDRKNGEGMGQSGEIKGYYR